MQKEKLKDKARIVRAKVQNVTASVELLIIRHDETLEKSADADCEMVAFEHIVFEITQLAIRG